MISIHAIRISGCINTGDMSVNPQAGDEIKIEVKNVGEVHPRQGS
jgi:hypothetical protein